VRALLVCAAMMEGSAELLAVLARDADLVIAVDGGGSLCLQAAVEPDLLLGDFDSLPAADLQRLDDLGVEILRFPAEKDSSDLELAVAEARRRGATSVVLTAASAGRLDHTLAVLALLAETADLRSHLADPDLDIWTLTPEGRDSIGFSGEGATVSLLVFGIPARVTAEGMVWELNDATLDVGSSLGLSNRIGPTGEARISAASGVVLAFAPQVAGTVRAQAT
jgi:thiamine pyrophosphokinase